MKKCEKLNETTDVNSFQEDIYSSVLSVGVNINENKNHTFINNL